MILVTGGLGFIGSHTTQALLDLGESCVLVQRREPVLPEDLAGHDGQRVFTERADVTDLAALLEVGTRHRITGLIHLAGSVPWPPGADEPLEGARKAIGSLLNVLQAARDWQVPRVAIASTIGVCCPRAAARDPARGSASTSAGSARTRATSPPTTRTPRSPITSPGCGPVTSGSSG